LEVDGLKPLVTDCRWFLQQNRPGAAAHQLVGCSA